MGASGRRGIRLAIGVAVALIGAGLTPASGRERLDSFDGSCSVQGDVRFSPPATNAQQPLSVVYDAAGTCSGELNGRNVSNAPVRLHHAAQDVDGSCVHADTTSPGRGAITFADGTAIRYSFEFHFVGADGMFSFHGQRSGSADGIGSFLTQRTPPDLALQCSGAGVSRAPLDVSLTTESPLVSRRHAGRRR